jgi:ribose 5-phosphate isomerase A
MNLKEQAARRALNYLHSGMILGLGTGSTTAHFLALLGEQLRAGAIRSIVGVPTSEQTAERARALDIPLATLADHARLDLAVDGADEVDGNLNLIKGMGRALLREKIVESHANRFLVLVDESKMVQRLGRGPLPVDLVPFGYEAQLRWLQTLGCRAELRLEDDGSPAITDDGNYMALCWFPDGIADPQVLSRALADRPGIVEHGLFLDMATDVIVAGSGGIHVLHREEQA